MILFKQTTVSQAKIINKVSMPGNGSGYFYCSVCVLICSSILGALDHFYKPVLSIQKNFVINIYAFILGILFIASQKGNCHKYQKQDCEIQFSPHFKNRNYTLLKQSYVLFSISPVNGTDPVKSVTEVEMLHSMLLSYNDSPFSIFQAQV